MRCRTHQAVAPLVLLVVCSHLGCGLIDRHEQKPSFLTGTSTTRSYPEAIDRVAAAMLEALDPEARVVDMTFDLLDENVSDTAPITSKMKWASEQVDQGMITTFEITAITLPDRRKFRVSLEKPGSNTGTQVSIKFDGKDGKTEFALVLLDRIADRLAHPENFKNHRKLGELIILEKPTKSEGPPAPIPPSVP